MLLVQRSGAFRLRSGQHDLVVDPTTCVLGRAGDPAEISHPYGTGDRGTFVIVAPEVAADFADASRVPATAPATGAITKLHQRLVASLVHTRDAFELEEAALRLFSAVFTESAARRRPGLPATSAARRRIVEDACGALAHDLALGGVVELSHRVGCSPHHLSRLFSQVLGKTMSRYRLELRVHAALDLLSEDGVPLSVIAARAGFSDHAHMTRSFRSVLGDTPSQLRRALIESTR